MSQITSHVPMSRILTLVKAVTLVDTENKVSSVIKAMFRELPFTAESELNRIRCEIAQAHISLVDDILD